MTFISSAQSEEDLSKPFNEVTFLVTHNAYNVGKEKFRFGNQRISVYDQLKGGVRGLCFDIYSQEDSLYQYHRYQILGKQKLAEDLSEIKTFLEEDSTAIVTIFVECYVRSGQLDTAFQNSGLHEYLFAPDSSEIWPTCREMLEENQRLVVFANKITREQYNWYLFGRPYVASTDYSSFRKAALSTDLMRGDSTLPLLFMNHFVYDWKGTGSRWRAKRVNDNDFLRERCLEMRDRYGKFPNFIAIDYFREDVIDLEVITAD